MAAGFWFNIGAESSAASHVDEDGSVTVISGTPDIGGSRASLAMMAAEELGVDYDKVRPVIADTALARLQLRDRRQPRHLRHRPRGGELGARHDPRAQGARRQDLEASIRRA